MATAEEYIQSILAQAKEIQNHPLRNEPTVVDALKDADERIGEVLDEIGYLENAED